MSEPPDPPGRGHWFCPWSEAASYAEHDPRDPMGAEFGQWLASPEAPEAVRGAPAAALLAAFYAGWESACVDHAGFTVTNQPEWVVADGDGEGSDDG